MSILSYWVTVGMNILSYWVTVGMNILSYWVTVSMSILYYWVTVSMSILYYYHQILSCWLTCVAVLVAEHNEVRQSSCHYNQITSSVYLTLTPESCKRKDTCPKYFTLGYLNQIFSIIKITKWELYTANNFVRQRKVSLLIKSVLLLKWWDDKKMFYKKIKTYLKISFFIFSPI